MTKVKREGLGALCDSCRNAAIARGDSGQTLVSCSEFGKITFKVHDCTAHDPKMGPPMWAMHEIAWELKTKGTGKELGFKPPKERSARLVAPWNENV